MRSTKGLRLALWLPVDFMSVLRIALPIVIGGWMFFANMIIVAARS
jgi:hypothetical protein